MSKISGVPRTQPMPTRTTTAGTTCANRYSTRCLANTSSQCIGEASARRAAIRSNTWRTSRLARIAASRSPVAPTQGESSHSDESSACRSPEFMPARVTAAPSQRDVGPLRRRGESRMDRPQPGQGHAADRIDEVGRDVGQRLEHEGVVQLRARKLEIAGAVEHQVAEIDDVDVQRAVAVRGVAAVAAMRFLQRMTPVVERERVDVAVDGHDGVEEIGPLETYGC